MKMIPIIAVVDETTFGKLLPLIDELIERMEASNSDLFRTKMILNGWSYPMLAWGAVLRGVSDIEIAISDGDETTIHILEGD
jgi:hypothetical protein